MSVAGITVSTLIAHRMPDSRPADVALIARTRLNSIDAGRFLAAIGVVWVHSFSSTDTAWSNLGRYGTAFFTMGVVLFAFRAAHQVGSLSFGDYAIRRTQRLVVPFLAWTAIYILLINLKYLWLGQGVFVPSMARVVSGMGMQLWFLPFALALSLIGYPVALACLRLNQTASLRVALGCAIAGSLWTCLPDYNFDSLGPFFYLPERTWEVVPAILWGVSLEMWLRFRGRPEHAGALVAVGLLLLGLATASYFAWGFSIAAKNAGGLGLMLAATATIGFAPLDALGRVGRFSFGIFLIHPCVLAGLQMLPRSAHVSPLGGDLLAWVVACAVSLGLTWAMSRSAFTRWLVR